MSEVNLSALAECGKHQIEAKAPTPMQEINQALKACKFGAYHTRLLFTSFFGAVSGIFVTNTTPYILPNAECDLNMNLLQKGVLNAMPFVGMIMSSMVAGFLTDTFGRKIFLVGGYAGVALFTMLSSLSQTYDMLLAGKFFEGLFFAAAFSPLMTYTSEYCHEGIRDRIMLLQSSFQSMGQVILAVLSWGILTQNWRVVLFDGYIVLNTWNLYLLLISLFSLTACLLFMILPESPKFLLTQHKYKEAKDILYTMYTWNTGKPKDTFPFAYLWKDKVLQAIDETPEKERNSIGSMLMTGFRNCKPIFRKPLAPYMALFCTMNFLVMVLYNVIRLWFPQLSTIVEHYQNIGADQGLCEMLDAYTSDLKIKMNSTIYEVCEPFHPIGILINVVDIHLVPCDLLSLVLRAKCYGIAGLIFDCALTRSGAETYINSIILGVVTAMPLILSGALVNKVGKKSLEIAAGFITIGCTLALRWASSKVQMVTLFATDMAVAQTMMSLLQAMTVEVFPTTIRTLAISMIMMSGRIGTLVGNVAFPILLDKGCIVPFFTLAGIMIGVTFMSVFLPKKKVT